MKLYHGALGIVREPLLEMGRATTDFGKGFYTTTNVEQAKRWALSRRKDTENKPQAFINAYEVDDNLLERTDLNIRQFHSPNEEWLLFVVACRRGVPHSCDLVFGPVANDKIYATIALYESATLSVEATIAQLRINEFYNQISFHSDAALRELTFIHSESLTI